MVTTRIRLDRIASSTKNAQLSHNVLVSDQIIAAEGYVLAVRILDDKTAYNTVEDLTGRMLPLRAGDILAGTLGARRALHGYAGEVPPPLAVGDLIDVLNLGGVLGRCTSASPELGAPFRAEVLGAILSLSDLGDRSGGPAHIRPFVHLNGNQARPRDVDLGRRSEIVWRCGGSRRCGSRRPSA